MWDWIKDIRSDSFRSSFKGGTADRVSSSSKDFLDFWFKGFLSEKSLNGWNDPDWDCAVFKSSNDFEKIGSVAISKTHYFQPSFNLTSRRLLTFFRILILLIINDKFPKFSPYLDQVSANQTTTSISTLYSFQNYTLSVEKTSLVISAIPTNSMFQNLFYPSLLYYSLSLHSQSLNPSKTMLFLWANLVTVTYQNREVQVHDRSVAASVQRGYCLVNRDNFYSFSSDLSRDAIFPTFSRILIQDLYLSEFSQNFPNLSKYL